MNRPEKSAFALAVFVYLVLPHAAFTQTHSTGRIAGVVVKDKGAVVPKSQITATHASTAEQRTATADENGRFVVGALAPGTYTVRITANGFASATYHHVRIRAGKTTSLNPVLTVTPFAVTVYESPPILRSDSPTLGMTLEAEQIAAMPLPTRNVLQLPLLAPGVTTGLIDNRAIGRNSPNVSVNGARNSQNNLQINGVDANEIESHDFSGVAVPAPESVRELVVQTSMPDISVGGGGGIVQISTQSGAKDPHGEAYEYFRNDGLNANDPNLKAAGLPRPILRRNVYGATVGGPLRNNRVFYFVSYQGTREENGATDQSLYKNVLIARGLTSDRSEATLLNTFHPVEPDGSVATNIDPIALKLLNTKLPNGRFLIPTPRADGRVTGSVPSNYREEQFNANLEFRLGTKDTLSPKFFFADAPQVDALGFVSLPGFASHIDTDNRVLSVRESHVFSAKSANELRFGYNFIHESEVNAEPLNDSDLGMTRSTASAYPGLPLIMLGRDDGAGTIGTQNVSLQTVSATLSVFDTVSLDRGNHHFRFGGEVHRHQWRGTSNVGSYGQIEFATFQDFLTGTSDLSFLGIGLITRDFRSTDYAAFANDSWKVSPKFTLNLGMRYELDLPPYEMKGQIGGFDPALYRPNVQVDQNDFPLGPPLAGFVEAGNASPEFSLPGVIRVGKRMLDSVGPLNFGPRVGLAWSPFESKQIVLSAGYGIFFSRPSFFYVGLDSVNPPFYYTAAFSGGTLSNPFPNAPPETSFPGLPQGLFVGDFLDRSNRTPYVQQYNVSLQCEPKHGMVLQFAYVGSRGLRLFRQIYVNQAQIASATHPIRNAVTGQEITSNSNSNAALRTPLQGVDPLLQMNQSNGQSTYHSFQASVERRLSHGLQFQVAYTYSKSIDNGSTPGGGALSDGSIDTSTESDTSNVIGNYLSARANRGLSDFDRTHRLAGYFIWSMPELKSVKTSSLLHTMLSNWEFSGVVTAMSGLPIDIFDPAGGSFYGLAGARPNWAPGANRGTAMTNTPSGYYFNPFAFAIATVQPGQAIPSVADPNALAGGAGTDVGNVGRNALRGPAQSNVDLSVAKRFKVREKTTIEFRSDFFNVFNHANKDNPVSDISVVSATGGQMDSNSGRIISPGDFGRILGYSSNPRIIQLSVKMSF
jgi:hypothetical protein